ncbi:hypothetical protein ACIP88_18575 [Streptomyces uncialis]|uniref:hypothetical protein n=1 Tax=Streptomyces uncialis TaxID=1048205 RepID=UPI003825254B
MERRRGIYLFLVALAAGLLTGHFLFPADEGGPDALPPKQSEKPRAAGGEKPRVSVGIRLGETGEDESWILMASAEIARRDPPAEVTDCREMRRWALAEGAVPTWRALHTLDISVNFSTDVIITSMALERDSYEQGDPALAPVARLSCLPRPGARISWRDPEAVPVVDGEEYLWSPDASLEYKVSRLKGASQNILVDLTGSPGQFTYRLRIGLETSLGSREVVASGEAGPLIGAEDGAGMGYWPAQYTWTMAPKRTLKHCPEVRDVRPGRAAECS